MVMGDKGGKKDKHKSEKQTIDKQKQQEKTKLQKQQKEGQFQTLLKK
jgi:hypothetical protein